MNSPVFRIEASDEFVHNLKHLNKKFRNIRTDIGTLTEQLAAGNLIGDRVQGAQSLVYKARVKSSDLSRGKSGGYRVIYYIKTSDRIVLITIYSKAEYSDVTIGKIKRIIDDYESSHP